MIISMYSLPMRIFHLVRLLEKPLRIIAITAATYYLLMFVDIKVIDFLGIKMEASSLRKLVFFGGALWATGSLLNKYLEFGLAKQNKESVLFSADDKNISELFDKQYSNFEDKIENIKLKLDNVEKGVKDRVLSDTDKDSIISSLKSTIFESASEDVINDIHSTISKSISNERFERIKKHFYEKVNRLIREVDALTRRARVNLIIGSITAIAGVSVFIAFVIESKSTNDATNYFLTNFTPRLSLVIVIEIFAYFFLGLYKSSLSEIKYFQNEITNIEFKKLSLIEAIIEGDKNTINNILDKFSETERNFLLKKGESTVSLEERRATMSENNAMFGLLKDLLKKEKSKP